MVIVTVGLAGCAGTSVRTSYVQFENQFLALGQQYDIHYDAGNVDAETHKKIIDLFKQVDVALDAYHLALLGGTPTDSIYFKLNQLKTQIILELTKL
jgi:hypothetical protein